MSRPKRFRDMKLTEEEVETMCLVNHFPVPDKNDNSFPMQVYRYNRLEARAKRLLPLWRKWRLQALYNQGHQAACVGYAHAAMRRIEGSK